MSKELALSVVVGAAIGRSFFSTMESADKTVKRLGNAWSATDKKLTAANGVIKYKQQLEKLKKKQLIVGTSSKRLNKGIADLEKRYKTAKRDAKAYGLSIANITTEQRRLQRELKKTEKAQAQFNRKQQAAQRLGQMKTRALGMVGTLWGGNRLADKAREREDEALYLRTVINTRDGNKDNAVGRAWDNAFDKHRNTLATNKEMLEIEYALNSAGLDEDLSRAGATITHKLGKITKGASGTVGEVLGTTFNNLGGQMEGTAEQKMQRIGNILAKTQFKYQIRDFAQLGESMKYAGAAASSSNIPIEQMSSALGLLNSAGLQGSMAGTAFTAVVRNLTKATEEFGTEIVRGADGQMDLVATMQQINDATQDMDIDERSNIFQQLFGDEGKRGVIPLLDKLIEFRKDSADNIATGNGNLVNEEYDRFLNSSSGKWTMFKQNIALVGETFANNLLPAVNAVLEPLGKFSGWVAQGTKDYPIISKMIGGFATTFVAVGTAMGVATAATWLWNAALLANPVGLVIGGIAALSVGIYAVWENWDVFIGKLKDGWKWIENNISDSWVGRWQNDDDDKKGAQKIGHTQRRRDARYQGHRSSQTESTFKPWDRARSRSRRPASSMRSETGQTTIKIDAPIAIHAAPGMDENALAELMRKKLNETTEQNMERGGNRHD
ncbi:phage tail tape measure protein [Pseudomonas sp. HK3]